MMTLPHNNTTTGNHSMPMYVAEIPSESILPPPLPDRVIICLIVCYSLIILLSVTFNLIVMVVIAGSKGKRSVTEIFILSLAVSDLLVSSLNMPFQLYYYVANVWNIGLALCKLSNYLQAVSIVSTVLTLTAIAIDRFVTICNPLGFRRFHTRKSAIGGLVAVWTLSLVTVSPQLVVQRLAMRLVLDPVLNQPIGVAFICAEFFPRGELDGYIYSLVIFVVLYVVPVVIMFLCYGAIAHRLWIRKPIGDILANPQSYSRQAVQRKKIIKVLITIVLAFTVLWFPFFSLSLYDDLQFEENSGSFRTIMAVLQLVGYSNCCVNPILFTFLNHQFQRDFTAVCCVRPRRWCNWSFDHTIAIKVLTPGVATATSVTINSLPS